MDNSSDGDRYRQTVERLYNKVVLENDLKWGPWDSSFRRDRSGQYDIDNTFRSLRWLNERGIQVRGHYLAWGNLDGDAATVSTAEKSPAQFRSLLLRHAEQKMVNVGNAVSEWDVVNHPFGWVSKNIRDVAGDDIYDEMFMKAKEWNPEPRRYINEGGILTASGHFPNKDRYLALIKDMLGRGVPVQGVGFMGHFFADNLTPPTKLLEILDHYAVLGLPLQVTEFDVRYGKAGEFVKLTAQQEKLQADYLRDFMITMFSHPSVTGVIMWGFWEGRHWYPSAALYRKDWSIKPNGRVWEDLVLRQWWTNEVGKTDAKGRFATRGFLGDYAVTVHLDGHKEVVKQFRLDPAGTTLEITVK
jgi:endo-1,4-beta-xylanase